MASASTMSPTVFAVFLDTLAKAAFSRDKLGTIEMACGSNWFTFPQVNAIMSKLPFTQDKHDALRLLSARMTDLVCVYVRIWRV